jgi:uncharacterized protein
LIAELGPAALVFVAAVCLLSGFGHGALGFGFPIVATPLIALVIDIKSAIALLAPITLVLTVISALRGGGLAALARRFLPLIAGAVIGASLGTLVLLAAPPEPFLLVLAGSILLYLNLERVGAGTSPFVQRREARLGIAFGFVGGVFEAIANVAGPILLIYFMLLGLAPAQMVQTLNLCFSMGKAAQTATWAASGALTPATWAAIGALTVPAVGALFAGMRVRSRIDAATYRRWLRGALWVMAALLLLQFAGSVLAADSALFQAIDEDREVAAAALVARGGIDLNARNAKRETALHRAVEKDMRNLAQALVKSGADLDATAASGETALHLAALHADPWLTELLLSAGADPKARDDDGASVLLWATMSGHAAVAERLLRRDADPNVADQKGNLPLHAAAERGDLALVRLLLPRTKEPDVKNADGQSPADYARSRGDRAIERLLGGEPRAKPLKKR